MIIAVVATIYVLQGAAIVWHLRKRERFVDLSEIAAFVVALGVLLFWPALALLGGALTIGEWLRAGGAR